MGFRSGWPMYSQVGGSASGTTLFESNLDAGKGRFTRSFRTDDGDGWYIGFKKLIKGQGKLVIDNIIVDKD